MNNFGYRAWWQPAKAQLGFVPVISGEQCFASEECMYGFQTLFGKKPGNKGDYTISLEIAGDLAPEAYTLRGGPKGLRIGGGCEKGLLYGVYGLLSRLCLGEPVETMNIKETPAVKHRVLNHWDKTDGRVGRGFAGASLFYRGGRFGYDLKRLKDYARLLASVGINEISVPFDISEEKLPTLIRVAEVFRPFGIRLIVALTSESPAEIKGHAKLIYKRVPDLAGFLLTADSEFYAKSANAIARTLATFGGTLYLRCVIDGYKQDWRDRGTDRMKAAYQAFYPLDGKLDDNVILQIPHSPADFAVRVPNSPLLGAMTKVHQGLEFQITQEYTGQQKDLYATAVQWEEILDTPVTDACMTRDLVGIEVTAMVAEANTGTDANWTGHLLAQANLYAFGRLAWNPAQTAEQLTRDWAALTFGTEPTVIEPLTAMLLESRRTFEKYTTPLGLGGMFGADRYGPSPESGEYTDGGTFHRATGTSIGVDRTTHGTEFTAQYHNYVRDLYENKKTCPERLLLFFHRLPYSYKLKKGKTLIQHIYDTHLEGVEDVRRFIEVWEGLKEKIPQEAYTPVRERFEGQLANASEWRDVVNDYFYRLSGIADEKGRHIN
jgi:alpha-glucuronidase